MVSWSTCSSFSTGNSRTWSREDDTRKQHAFFLFFFFFFLVQIDLLILTACQTSSRDVRKLNSVYMLYRHNDFNISYTNIYIQIQADSVVSDTNGFINFWLRSFNRRRETQIIKAYVDPHPNVRCILWCLRFHLCCLRSEKLNHYLQRSTSTHCLFNILKFSSGHDVIYIPAPFHVWSLLWQIMIVVSFPRGGKTAPSDDAPGQRDPSSSKPYQTK